MPQARYKTVIAAPYDRVAALLADKVEHPKKYVGTVLHSRILERGQDYVIREMYEPRPVAMTIRERISVTPVEGGEDTFYEHVDNPRYTGGFHNVLTRIAGRDDAVELEYVMDWRPRDGVENAMPVETAQRIVRLGVHHIRNLAENPPVIPNWLAAFFDAIDAKHPEALAPLLADSCKFRFGSTTDVIGARNVIAANTEVLSHFESISHDIAAVSQDGARTYVECYTSYGMPDGAFYMLPFMTLFEREDDRIVSVRVYGDPSPLVAGWPAAA